MPAARPPQAGLRKTVFDGRLAESACRRFRTLPPAQSTARSAPPGHLMWPRRPQPPPIAVGRCAIKYNTFPPVPVGGK